MKNPMLHPVEELLSAMSAGLQFECLWEEDGSFSIVLDNQFLEGARITAHGVPDRRDEQATTPG